MEEGGMLTSVSKVRERRRLWGRIVVEPFDFIPPRRCVIQCPPQTLVYSLDKFYDENKLSDVVDIDR